jgi:hypothetical protein
VIQRIEPIADSVDSAIGKTSINMENLMKMKEEYIFQVLMTNLSHLLKFLMLLVEFGESSISRVVQTQ